MASEVEAFHIKNHVLGNIIFIRESGVMDCGVDDDEGNLERVEEGTGGVINGVWLGG